MFDDSGVVARINTNTTLFRDRDNHGDNTSLESNDNSTPQLNDNDTSERSGVCRDNLGGRVSGEGNDNDTAQLNSGTTLDDSWVTVSINTNTTLFRGRDNHGGNVILESKDKSTPQR